MDNKVSVVKLIGFVFIAAVMVFLISYAIYTGGNLPS